MDVARVVGLALLTGLVVSLVGGLAHAATTITVKTQYYQISGQDGRTLLKAMDRYGPKQGFTSRAIAQTRYTMHSSADWSFADGVCRPRNISIDLAITYVYPRPSARLSPVMKQRWKRFMAGVVVHEQKHGRIARDMAAAARQIIAAMAIPDRPNCPSVQRVMKRRVVAIVAEYEARQERFDAAEHRKGGAIDRLMDRLVDG